MPDPAIVAGLGLASFIGGAVENYRKGLDFGRRLKTDDTSQAKEARAIIAALVQKAPDVHVYGNDLAWLDAQCGG